MTWRARWTIEVTRTIGLAINLSQHAGIVVTPPLSIYDLGRILEEFDDFAETIDDRLFAWSPVRGWHELRP